LKVEQILVRKFYLIHALQYSGGCMDAGCRWALIADYNGLTLWD